MDIGFVDGLVVLRKRLRVSASQVRAMLAGGGELPDATPAVEREVAEVVADVRKGRRRRKGTA